jgi:hypothetical protein
MSEVPEVLEIDGASYVALSEYDQQENQALRAQLATCKSSLILLFQQTAEITGLEPAQQAVRRRTASGEQQQHTGQEWLLQALSGFAVKDDLSLGETKVDVCRIVRTNGPANQEQQAQDGSTADTQPLFRPYDAVKLVAGLSTCKPGDKEQQQQLTKLVSDRHRMKLLIAVGLFSFTAQSDGAHSKQANMQQCPS